MKLKNGFLLRGSKVEACNYHNDVNLIATYY